MKSPYCFIVKPRNNVRYDNVSSYGDGTLITSVSQEDHHATNRHAIVLSAPLNYDGPIKTGDTIIVHHNVFRKYYDMKGQEKSGPCHLKDDIYIVEPDQIYLYKSNINCSRCNNTWKSNLDYCFVRPKQKSQGDVLSLSTEEELIGEMVYSTNYLKEMGIKVGDDVSFLPDSEYGFKIDGEKLYRMRQKNIVAKL